MDSSDRPDPVPAGDRGRPGDGDPGPLVARCPRRPRQCPGCDLHHHQHRRRPDLQPRDLRQSRTRPPSTRSRARPSSSARRPITSRAGTTARRDSGFGYGNQMGLAVFDGQVYPIWAGNFNQGLRSTTSTVTGRAAEHLLPADGHRRRAADHQQHDGADPAGRGGQRGGHHLRHLRPAGRSRHVQDRRCPGLLSRHHQWRSLHPAPGDGLRPNRRWEQPHHPVHGHLQPQPEA